jgi:hypothetical protein
LNDLKIDKSTFRRLERIDFICQNLSHQKRKKEKKHSWPRKQSL